MNIKKQYKNYLPWIVCFVAALFYCYEFLLRVAPTVMIEDFRSTFLLNGSGIGFLLACYSFAYTPLQLPGGPLLDYYGPRKILLLSIVLCCLGSFLIPFSVNLYVTQISLFLIGIGSAFSFVAVLKLSVNWLPYKYFSFIAGLTTTLGMFGAIFGQSLMSSIVMHKNWLYAWKVSGIIGIILFVLMYIFIHDNPQHSNEHPHIKQHLHIFEPIKEFLKLMIGNKQFLLNGLVGGCLFLPISVFGSSWGIEFLRYSFGLNAAHAASAVPFVFAGLALGGPLFGWICAKYKRSKIFMQMGNLCLIVLFLILIFVNSLSLLSIKVILFLIGFCVGPETLIFHRSVLFSSAHLAGSAAASTNFIVMIPAMIYPILIGFLLDFFASNHAQTIVEFTKVDFQYAMMILPISLIAAFVLTFFMQEEKSV